MNERTLNNLLQRAAGGDVDAILAIRLPELIFGATPAAAKKDFRRLALLFHPDRCRHPKAGLAFACLEELYKSVLAKIGSGEWQSPFQASWLLKNGCSFELPVLRRHSCDIGELVVGEDNCVWRFASAARALAEPGLKLVRTLPFGDSRMKAEMANFLPLDSALRFTSANDPLWLAERQEDEILLADLSDSQGLDLRHIAWIVGSLLHIACYLQYANIMHGGISLQNCLVSPPRHTVRLVGGWWYAARGGENLAALPGDAVGLMPPAMVFKKTADSSFNHILIQQLVRELLGDPSGTTAAFRARVPAPVRRWLSRPGGEASEAYAAWRSALEEVYGKRKFIPLEVSAKDVYGR